MAPLAHARDPRERVRWSNERIARRALQLHFRSRVPLLCECSARRCDALILIGADDYARLRRLGGFVVAPGHAVDGARVERRETGYWVQSASRPARGRLIAR